MSSTSIMYRLSFYSSCLRACSKHYPCLGPSNPKLIQILPNAKVAITQTYSCRKIGVQEKTCFPWRLVRDTTSLVQLTLLVTVIAGNYGSLNHWGVLMKQSFNYFSLVFLHCVHKNAKPTQIHHPPPLKQSQKKTRQNKKTKKKGKKPIWVFCCF